MIYVPAIIYIFGTFLYSYNSYFSIRQKTNTWKWHFFQWFSILLFTISGILFGFWCKQDFTFHYFGEIIGIAVLSIGIYVFNLHRLLRK